jgi:YgiT-type zinc finger domain-containing protein
MRKERIIQDPEFGPVRVPQRPRPTPKEWAEDGNLMRARIRKRRFWKLGEVHECPRCGKDTFVGADRITRMFTKGGKTFVFLNMRGAECTECGAHVLEAHEQITVEDHIGAEYTPNYGAKVTRIGSGSLGTYWPKDVERLLGLQPNTRAFIEVVGPNAVFVRFQRPPKDRNESQP